MRSSPSLTGRSRGSTSVTSGAASSKPFTPFVRRSPTCGSGRRNRRRRSLWGRELMADPTIATDDRDTRIFVSLWTQVAELCGAMHSPARFQAFLALHASLLTLESERSAERFATGYERGADDQARRMGDDYRR